MALPRARRAAGTKTFTDLATHPAQLMRVLRGRPATHPAKDTEDPPYHFQLFVNDDGTALVACLGVDQAWNPNRHVGW